MQKLLEAHRGVFAYVIGINFLVGTDISTNRRFFDYQSPILSAILIE